MKYFADLFIAFVLGFTIGIFLGVYLGHKSGKEKAIEAGVAYYSVNPTTGVTSFNFKTNAANTVEKLDIYRPIK